MQQRGIRPEAIAALLGFGALTRSSDRTASSSPSAIAIGA
jgi:hypothetical protein